MKRSIFLSGMAFLLSLATVLGGCKGNDSGNPLPTGGTEERTVETVPTNESGEEIDVYTTDPEEDSEPGELHEVSIAFTDAIGKPYGDADHVSLFTAFSEVPYDTIIFTDMKEGKILFTMIDNRLLVGAAYDLEKGILTYRNLGIHAKRTSTIEEDIDFVAYRFFIRGDGYALLGPNFVQLYDSSFEEIRGFDIKSENAFMTENGTLVTLTDDRLSFLIDETVSEKALPEGLTGRITYADDECVLILAKEKKDASKSYILSYSFEDQRFTKSGNIAGEGVLRSNLYHVTQTEEKSSVFDASRDTQGFSYRMRQSVKPLISVPETGFLAASYIEDEIDPGMITGAELAFYQYGLSEPLARTTLFDEAENYDFYRGIYYQNHLIFTTSTGLYPTLVAWEIVPKQQAAEQAAIALPANQKETGVKRFGELDE